MSLTLVPVQEFRGGEIVGARPGGCHQKNPAKSLTGQYLSGRQQIEVPPKRRPIGEERITVRGAMHHNLRNVDVEFPLGVFICVDRGQRLREKLTD